MHLEPLASLSADIEPWRARLLCTPNVWRRPPPIRAFVSLSPPDEALETWSYVNVINLRNFSYKYHIISAKFSA